MYRNISGMTEAQWNDAVTNAGRYVLTKAVFNGDTTLYGDGTDGAVVSIKFDEQMENSNGLSMGGTIASQCKIDIRQPSTPIQIVNSVFNPYVGLNDGTHQGYVPLGEFFATSADSNSNGGTVSIVGYDRFCKLEVPYEPTVSFPTTTTAIMADLATNRFTFSGTVTERTIDHFVVGTVKDWIGWLAGLEGKNARFNRDGELEFTYYDITQYDYTVDRENQYMSGVNTKTADNVTINAITSGTEENPIVSGNGRSITFSNPYMTQEILDDIRNTEIVDSLTEVSGELITVDAIEAPAKSVEVNVEPYQNLNGYDSPWVGGAGKNKFLANSTGGASANVSFVRNADGSVTFTGLSNGTTRTPTIGEVTLPSGSYILNGVTGGSDSTYQLRIYINGTMYDTISSGDLAFTLNAESTVKLVGRFSANQTTEFNVTMYPMIRLSTESADYAPYENICPIYPATKNLIPKATDDERDAVTFTVAEDGKITVSGTPSTSRTLAIATLTLKANHTYVLSGAPVGGGSGKWGLGLYDGSSWIASDWGDGAIVTPTANTEVTVRIRYWYNYQLVSKVFAPQLENIAKTPYAPYQGISIARTGKNLVNQAGVNGTSGFSNVPVYVPEGVYYWFQVTGNMSHNTYYRYSLDGVTFKNIPTTDDGYAVATYSSGSYNRPKNKVTVHQSCWISCRLALNANTGAYPVDVMLTTDDTGYASFPTGGGTLAYGDVYTPYEGGAVSVAIGQDVYGGTLDVTTGLLTVLYAKYNITSFVGTFGATTNGYAYYAVVNGTTHVTTDIAPECMKSNIFTYTKNGRSTAPLWSYGGDNGGATTQTFILPSTIPTLTDANTWLASHPVECIFRLATPQTYQLTPAQVELLKGINNIWADNSTLNVTYLATPRANMSFRPMELQWRGNPCVQCGDRIFVETETNSLTALVMAHTLSIEGGMDDVIKCFGSSDAEVALDKSPMEKKISAAYNALQSAIQDATALLNGTRGGIFEITKENDINTGWLIKESASPNYMGNVIVANYNGIGFSTDGGATYGTAITTDGHINGQYITAHSVDVEALSVGNTSDPFSNYVYIGRRRPNDDNTDMVIRIGVASQSMVQEMRGNRTSIYKAEDVQAYVDGSLTDAQLDARALMYYSDTDYVLLNLGSFRIGGMLMQAQANGGVKFIKAE